MGVEARKWDTQIPLSIGGLLMSLEELEAIDQQMEVLRKQRENIFARARNDALENVRQKVKQFNFTAKEIGIEAPDAPPSLKPKYVNSANPKQTWAGRGMAPRWLVELERQGHKREEFLVQS
jgi:DNA-binding protein H-NS